MAITIAASGPAFDGRAQAALDSLTVAAVKRLADVGQGNVLAVLSTVLRNPTGAYEGSIATERQGNDRVIIGDRLIYGPWLEGLGSRNKTTRFKGYFTFRLVAQHLNSEAGFIIAPVVQDHVRRMQ